MQPRRPLRTRRGHPRTTTGTVRIMERSRHGAGGVTSLARSRRGGPSTKARRVACDLALAQSRARTYSSSLTVTFDLANNKYSAPMPDPSHPSSSTYTVGLAGDPYGATLASAAFGGGGSVTFDGFGTPTTSGTVVVQVGDLQRTVTVNAGTGAVSWQ